MFMILLLIILMPVLSYIGLIFLVLIKLRSRYNDYYDSYVLNKKDKEYIF